MDELDILALDFKRPEKRFAPAHRSYKKVNNLQWHVNMKQILIPITENFYSSGPWQNTQRNAIALGMASNGTQEFEIA